MNPKTTHTTIKKNLFIIYGGYSEEHEISIKSAINVMQHINTDRYTIYSLYISKNGDWILHNDIEMILSALVKGDTAQLQLGHRVMINTQGQATTLETNPITLDIHIAFPVLHGPYGEDGTIQGLFEVFKIPYAGSGVLSSALCMDKDYTKRLVAAAGFPVCDYAAFTDKNAIDLAALEARFGFPMFIKPARLGSSVGVNKALNHEEALKAIDIAFNHDSKILIEEYIQGRELECGVLNVQQEIMASCVGEISPNNGFYTYENKYLHKDGANLYIPAEIPTEVSDKIKAISIQVFKLLDCKGFARVDFFLTKDMTLYVNEINTIPGFTDISMFSKLWIETGVSYPQQIQMILDTAET